MTKQHSPKPPQPRLLNVGVAMAAGQAGCVTIVIILLAVALGLWLDSLIGRRGLCTLGLVILSIPFSLALMLKLAFRTVNREAPKMPQPDPSSKEE
ncbi:MAG: AtpZ/AtpI family protein [Chloroflexi bacterium]|nr:AtpZ/AtpI family protein [Chloroflexota bacterium]